MRWFEQSAEIVETCGGCHADVPSMRPYNLPVDQLALYEYSAHGLARASGAELAPVCVDCHENHHVLDVANPASPASAANLPRTCGRCHADVELMTGLGTEPGVVPGFSRTAHARALDDGAGPSCARCHDGHGAVVPLAVEVDEVCGGCHEETRTSLHAGSHRPLLDRPDLAGCASCHPVHSGLAPRSLDAICGDCHPVDSDQVALGVDLQLLLRDAEEEIARAEASLSSARRVPLDTRDHEALVDDARGYLRQARAELHTFEHEPIVELARASRSISSRVHEEIDQRLARRPAYTELLILWFYAAVTCGVLARFRWRALRRGQP
jgi:predicted CXXCH cytochrome family protein